MLDPTDRFSFGKNWQHFIEKNFSEERTEQARTKLLRTLRLPDLGGLTFLDIGCGSGLHSLAAYKSGAARIVSFDYDPYSVATTRHLRELAGAPGNWTVSQGSILDTTFVSSLEPADIVYSWGVLHHTGHMWQAIENARIPLKLNGIFFIALYSYTAYMNGHLMGQPSPEEWLEIKQRYNKSSALGKRLLEAQHLWRGNFAWAFPNPLKLGWAFYELLKTIRQYKQSRGMNYWTDVRDWLGGWPMEFVKEDAFMAFCHDRLGLETLDVITGEGNSEFILRPLGAQNAWDAVLAQRVARDIGPAFARERGLAWSFPLPDLAEVADTDAAPKRSSLALLEDGNRLLYGHSPHRCLEELGGGRYSHWKERLLFSTSDNSDPNANGRNYSIVYDA